MTQTTCPFGAGFDFTDPDLLLLSYTGCFTFLKWFELLGQEYDCPVTMLHVPYQGDGVMATGVMRKIQKQFGCDMVIDSTLFKEERELLKQIAVELGEWNEKKGEEESDDAELVAQLRELAARLGPA